MRIVDFGLASILHDEEETLKTVCGTWAYCAPEVRTSRGNYNEKVDTWSLGVIMFVILAAYHPFDVMGDATDEDMIRRARNNEWDFDDDAWVGVSEGMHNSYNENLRTSIRILTVILHPSS